MLRYLAALLCLSGCQAVLGMEDAQVDPSLDPSRPSDGGAPPTGSSTTPLGSTTCEVYCATVTQTCSGEFAQYTTYDSCLGVCMLMPEGTDGDISGNSVFCRLQAAGQAPLEPSYYCPVAGPGGNGVCGTNCEALCSLFTAVCSAVVEELPEEPCSTSCAKLEDKMTYSVAPEAELYEGKHVQCRLYHASVAIEADTEQHCQHALGKSPCD